MTNWFFDAPAFVNDFKDPNQWHQEMVGEARDIIKILVGTALGKDPDKVTPKEVQTVSPTLAYTNPVDNLPPENAKTVGIAPWGAFPRAVVRQAPWPSPFDPDDTTGNYRAVEHLGDEDHYPGEFRDDDGKKLDLPVRDRQDEYLEWVVRRNSEGVITKAIFVAEGYDYYSTLFKYDEQSVVDLYQEFTGLTNITADDLRARNGIIRHTKRGNYTVAKKGEFNPRNQYNINPGIVHLSHKANSLGAEVNLAGVSGIARKDVKGNLLQIGNPELLLCCSEGGDPNRNSDPLIGEQAYTQVLAKQHYTLSNPVGLYVAGIENERLSLSNGDPVPQNWWKVVRGADLWDSKKSRVLRLEIEVPAEEGFSLGDLLVDGNPLKYGGQLAELLSVHLFVTVWPREDNSVGPIVSCGGTCCKKPKSTQLIPTEDHCPSGYSLAFEDLIPAQQIPHTNLLKHEIKTELTVEKLDIPIEKETITRDLNLTNQYKRRLP